ncbi:efflux transporter outer membrane subunit [Nitrosomonas sp. Nm33]|uniref:efflux transporter outer membrane subunit n=1 Tax=Nitrosomonas sp. Nm33 TaxID=133724 RepID=UPI000897F185|nr:efflux transporter outer membrane subunit [Nitrosomonas sp. Nm33]SDY05759.1 efflux transporter, outer membrane factor (OMF) lipoprotein, NodT family [Nitrosomonas sp. Nm33]
MYERFFHVKAKCIVGGLWVVWLLTATGCAVGPDFVRPQPPETDRYIPGKQLQETVSVDDQIQYFEYGAEIAADWWQLFKSPKLDALVKEAITNNSTLQAAQAALQQSQDNLRAGYGTFYPQIDLTGGVSRQKFSTARFGIPASAVFNLYTLSATVSYTLDVFGGQRRTVESLSAKRDMQRYTVLATYLTLIGNIVNTVIARAAYEAQIQTTQQLIESQQAQIKLTEFQLQAGIITYESLVNLRTQLEVLEASLPLLKQKYSQAEHLLATLIGQLPGERELPRIDLADLSLPTNLPLTLPSSLVRQRPDILLAEAQLHENSANIGIATAAMFPSFTLSGTYGQNNRNLLDIFLSSGNFWSIGTNFVAPLFRGGILWFQRKAAIDAYEQSRAQYRQTILDALGQVADVLLALKYDAEALQHQSQELNLVQERMQLIQTNYQAGLVNYQQVLITQSQYFQSKLNYLQTLALRFQDTAALFVALGGGWWNFEEKKLSSRDSEILFDVQLLEETGKVKMEH